MTIYELIEEQKCSPFEATQLIMYLGIIRQQRMLKELGLTA